MAGRLALAELVGVASSLVLLASCGSTLDSLGCKERAPAPDGGTVDPGLRLGALLRPESYPNAFRDLLGKSDDEIAAKIADTFDQLFHGDPTTEAIFVPVGTDQAYIRDVLHDQVRTEGMGLGMLITVMLDKRDEFDRLWRYTKSMQIVDGPAQGYFPSVCGSAGNGVSCNDPFGIEQIATALLLARGRWQATPGGIDYGLEAASLLDLIRNLEAYNCGVVDGTTAVFDAKSKLPYDTPTTASAGVSRPSIVMPAYYDLWHQATGDPFWSEAAAAGRAYWQASAHPTTGLLPDKATFDGKPVPGFENFDSECQRIWFGLALDRIWSGTQSWLVDEGNRLLQFFYGNGLTTYGRIFSLDGTTIQTPHDRSLVAANGMLALVATTDIRRDFVSEVWNLGAPVTGTNRYYPGLMQLLAFAILSGQMQVY
jgi:oligosaccharide reducing-end xylanase